ncbi:hypothetical protein GCM10025867_47830 (plasmid) [Frondihabitans sucicola]|uniref:Calcineurin-like phosphoesterase domain-containing protein n=1 Tax=Frondihabitans sucicola TaxID=1268041 RepID=A0ABN6Y5D3_9MICO|nr:metallophosphoesterase [Frondihabitans sucicola]BDZ52542.1 hypothetical protein GCM10025867_47830 [Frondihabitans sucicola]
MSEVKIMQTGDEHIDTESHGAMNPTTGINTAWESNQACLLHLATAAVDRQADAFVSAGDLFKSGRPSQEAVLMYVEAMLPVAKAGIPIVILDGNHHMTGVSSDHRTVIETIALMLRGHGATVHVASHPKLIRLDNGIQIAALPWLSKNRILNHLGASDLTPAEGDRRVAEYAIQSLTKMAEEADASSPLIMASHVTIDDLQIDHLADNARRGSEMDLATLFSEPVLPRAALEEMPFSYIGLSHIHTPQSFGGKTYYAGSPNRLTFTDMPDDKGGNFVTIDEKGKASVERIRTPARVMKEIDLEDAFHQDVLASLEPDTLVLVKLVTGDPEMPRDIKKAIADAGAILADTKARPAPRPEPIVFQMPEKVSPLEALRTWAEVNAPRDIDPDTLVNQYARQLEEA